MARLFTRISRHATRRSVLNLNSSMNVFGIAPRVTGRKMATTWASGGTDATEVDKVFDSFDANGDNVLSRAEFRAALGVLQYEEFKTLSTALNRNEISMGRESPKQADSMTVEEEKGFLSSLIPRSVLTLEVMFSKIFPAGFGWQTGCALAERSGFTSDDSALFLITGLGDGLGVLVGHIGYCALKKAVYDGNIDMQAQVHTGTLLGTAAVFSGTAWQPIVNVLSSSGFCFNSTVAGATIGCGLMFFTGLRLSRAVYGGFLKHVEAANYGNLKADAALSLSVGGATGAFVGCDLSYGAANWLGNYVGVTGSDSALVGSFKAGASTFLGFGAMQSIQNVLVPKGKCWVD